MEAVSYIYLLVYFSILLYCTSKCPRLSGPLRFCNKICWHISWLVYVCYKLHSFHHLSLTTMEEIHAIQLISQSAYNLKPHNILKRSGINVQERNKVRRGVKQSKEQGERTNELQRLSSDESFRRLCSN